jgi:hypothetical protein
MHFMHFGLERTVLTFSSTTRNAALFPGRTHETRGRHSSVGIALGYGLEDRGSGIPFPEGAGKWSLHHRIQNDSGAHPISYPMGTRGSFPGGKAAGA